VRPLPKTITISGKQFKIQVSDLSEEGLHGDSSNDTKIIRISSKLSPKDQFATLFHECIHMSLEISGISYMLTDQMEEAIVRCVEYAIYPLLTKFIPKST